MFWERVLLSGTVLQIKKRVFGEMGVQGFSHSIACGFLDACNVHFLARCSLMCFAGWEKCCSAVLNNSSLVLLCTYFIYSISLGMGELVNFWFCVLFMDVLVVFREEECDKSVCVVLECVSEFFAEV